MSNPFDYTNSILVTKKNMMRGTENDSLAEKGYNPWLANMAMSYHEDTVLISNLMNQFHYLPNRAQYELALALVRPKKRQFRKWAKVAVNEDLDMICEVYQCNKMVGQEYLKLLTPHQINVIRETRLTGGKASDTQVRKE